MKTVQSLLEVFEKSLSFTQTCLYEEDSVLVSVFKQINEFTIWAST